MLIFSANDLVDEKADRIRRTMEVNPAPKALLDGTVTRRAMAYAALAGAAMVLAAGHFLAAHTGQRAPSFLAMTAVLCVVVYEFYPFRLNYRGGGELVEAFGVGVVLPLFGAAACGASSPRALAALLPSLGFLGLASAIGSTLGDANADAAAGKNTVSVRLGAGRAATASAVTLNAAAFAAMLGSLAGKPSAAVVAIAIAATMGRVISASKAWNGLSSDGLSRVKSALGRSVQTAWIAAVAGFALDRIFS